MDTSKYQEQFVSEFEEHLSLLNNNLVTYEKDTSNTDLLNDLMRSSHTIKGLAATMGYTPTAELAHKLEDLFDGLRSNPQLVDEEIIELMYQGIDQLELCKQQLALGKSEPDSTGIQSRIADIITSANLVVDGKPVKKAKSANTKVQPAPVNIDKPKETNSQLNYIKVPVARLDTLINLVEELFIERLKLDKLKQSDKETKVIVDSLNRLISEIQFYTLQTRLVPVEQIFTKFPRMVRDLAKKVGKEVKLQITNPDIELDRTVIDRLSEPLVHLIRNAIDHGVATSGYVLLSAEKKNEEVAITVQNDGNSIDIERVKQKAIERGIVSTDQANSMTKQQVIDLLFHPNLSTKDKITETSGRGVGLSVVKTFVEQFGGRVSIESPIEEEDQQLDGTRVRLEVPTSLSIIKALIALIDGGYYAISYFDIDRSLRYSHADIQRVADSEVVVVDKQEIPIIYPHQLFSSTPPPQPTAAVVTDQPKQVADKTTPTAETDSKHIVVINSGQSRVALIVDRLISEKEIVIKPFPPSLKEAGIFSGVTILDEGKLALVLDARNLKKQ